MAATFELEIATPERLLLREQVSEASIPAKNGYIGVLPEHAPLISELGAGVLTYTPASGQSQKLAIGGGYVEVLENHVRVLANAAEKASDINPEEARQALEKAKKEVEAPAGEVTEVNKALDAMYHAQARVDATQQ